jgi:murein L,D-transpeptidase YcbB/YkuD
MMLGLRYYLSCLAAAALPGSALASSAPDPEDLVPPVAPPSQAPAQPPVVDPVGDFLKADDVGVQPVEVVRHWPLADAQALVKAIHASSADGLTPADYQLAALRSALLAGEGPELDALASKSFTWLVEDMRDGRTPMDARKQWFVIDPDADRTPTAQLMDQALASHDITGVLASIAPTHPDYALLKKELAGTPLIDTKRRALIRANMDRWRWLPRDLGKQYLMTNVPEFQLRLTVNNKIIRTYKTIVGKPGKTATPQLAEMVEGVIFNPTWTVPQSIVVGEGLGAKLLRNPNSAEAQQYTVTKGADGFVSVVQKPGPQNSLGLVKLDMPNEHAIFLHDTPGRHLFNTDTRALSHGCIRTERASELAITLAILRAGLTPEQAVALNTSGIYTKVPFTNHMPVYITYFTMARDITGAMSTFTDLYGRDAPVLASFRQPRVEVRQRVTDEAVVPLADPGV